MDVRIEDEQFEDWVLEAIDALPQAFRERLGSVAIVVAEWPTAEQLRSVGAPGLYGLYSGVPRNVPRRGLGADAVADHDLPRARIERHARTPEAMRAQVIDTVHHEIAHHFGISDARLRELARERTGTQAGRLAVDARILLVEDDPSIREITAIGLRAAGFEVETAADGADGLERWRRERPDLVLLDVMLPRLDGLEVLRAIRREATTPVVMLTARGDTIDVVVGPGVGRRRLRAQAVRDAGARGPRPGGAPAPGRGRRRRAGRRSSGSGRCASTPPDGP